MARPVQVEADPTPTRGRRHLPVGAEPASTGGFDFRVWAPAARRVEVVFDGKAGRTLALRAEGGGYFSGTDPTARAGDRYAFRLDGKPDLLPDPVSRFQPDGPHGPSQLVDPSSFAWTDSGWPGVKLPGQVVYELHVGTFTPEGTFDAAAGQLPELADLGITLVELMPVCEFPGRFGWGYDGVNLFAPYHVYGSPDDLRRFIDRAHEVGIGVVLDVVYNHVGPDGNCLPFFAPAYFSTKHKTDWGEAINFDGPDSGPVREYFLANAAYWIDEFHLDGLRIDATQDIHDDSPDHILAAIARTARKAAGRRSVLLIGENEPQHAKLVRPPSRGGYGLDALWNDDFHHSAMVAMTGRTEAYYTDYRGTAPEFVAAAKWGYLYQGQRYQWQKKRRGTPALDIEPPAFVNFTQNHDQIANSGRGQRCQELTSPGQYKALTALLLLGPGTPMLFQGQEFATSTPFYYFADHKPDLADLVRKGRGQFLSQFRSLAQPDVQAMLPVPSDRETFEASKLKLSERETHAHYYQMTKDLLRLRREEPFRSGRRRGGFDAAVLTPAAFLLRYFGADGDDRLLVVNLGRDLHYSPAPEPLLAPPEGKRWVELWSSEDPAYGGNGTAPLETEDDGWRIPGHAAVVLRPA